MGKEIVIAEGYFFKFPRNRNLAVKRDEQADSFRFIYPRIIKEVVLDKTGRLIFEEFDEDE